MGRRASQKEKGKKETKHNKNQETKPNKRA
jgi:hypothetical protein